MLTQEEDVDAHALRRRGGSISAIARHLGKDRKTIRAYLNGERTAGVRSPAGPDVFEPFVTSKKSGQGLGLALVRRLLRDMNGRINHERDEAGGWTHFRLHLAMAQEPRRSAQEEAA